MSATTQIEWTDATWNPTRGCTRVSPGCGGPAHQGGCYAEKIAARFSGPGQPFHGFAERTPHGGRWTGKLALVPELLELPLRWKKPRRIFVNSMSDLFHEALPDDAIDKVFAVMALCPQHTFQVLTKRAKRMRAYLDFGGAWQRRVSKLVPTTLIRPYLPNLWLGVSTEDQAAADERIPYLLATPAARRFVSAEPLLGPVVLTQINTDDYFIDALSGHHWVMGSHEPIEIAQCGKLDWVISGGESGPNSRPANRAWFRMIRADCEAAGVPFFFKQWGEHDADGKRVGKKAAGATLDGCTHREFPT